MRNLIFKVTREYLRFFLIKCSSRESHWPFKILRIKRYLEHDFKVEEEGRGFRKPGSGIF